MQIKIIGKYVLSAPRNGFLAGRIIKHRFSAWRPTWAGSLFAYRTILLAMRRLVDSWTRRPADNKVFNRKTLLTYCPPGGPWPAPTRRRREGGAWRERKLATAHYEFNWIVQWPGTWACGTGPGPGLPPAAADCLYFDFMGALSAPERGQRQRYECKYADMCQGWRELKKKKATRAARAKIVGI